jgi:hypothetical protein
MEIIAEIEYNSTAPKSVLFFYTQIYQFFKWILENTLSAERENINLQIEMIRLNN